MRPGLVLALQSSESVADLLLVVDPDGDLRRIYAAHFTQAGFEVRCAATIAEAAALLDGTPFDALIADVRDGESGAEGDRPFVDRLLRARARVVVLTAYGEPSWAETAARLRVDAFLHKPASLVWLEEFLRSRIDQSRRLGEAAPVAATG